MAGKRSNPLRILFDLAAVLPWWVGLVLAVASFAALQLIHQSSAIPLAVNLPDQMWRGLLRSIVAVVSGVGRYVLPVLFCAGSVASAINLWRGRRALSAFQQGGLQAVEDSGWRDFERLCRELLKQRGCFVAETNPGADGGVDLRLKINGRKLVVQCKHWPRRAVDVKVIRELQGVVSAERADGGIVITSGRFTARAREFASGVGLELFDGDALAALSAGADEASSAPVDRAPVEPACPRCQGPMIERQVKRGGRTGTRFLGCRSYPDCRGTRELPA